MAIEQQIQYEANVDRGFTRWLEGVAGGEKLRQCIQCGTCSAACPLANYMDYTPRKLMHLARSGFRDEVLGSFTIWLCASCYACAVQCPKQIDITDLMYALKRRAIREGRFPARFPIPALADAFLKMVRRHGRISEGRLVLKLALDTGVMRLFGLSRLGLRLLRTGRFSIRHDSIRGRRQLQTLLDAVDSRQ